MFAKLNKGIFFPESTLVTRIFKYRWRKNVLSRSVSRHIVGCINSGVFHSRSRLRRQSSNLLDTMLSELDYTIAYLDNILRNSQNVEQHKEHVYKVFSRIQGYGFKLKESKCDFFKKIKYLRHVIDKDGRRPDPEQATAKHLFLTKFLRTGKLLPNMHNSRALLNELLKKKTVLGVETCMPGSIRQNKRSLDVGLVSYSL